MARRVLITGANGLLGQKLVTELARLPGTVIIATGKGPQRVSFGSVKYLELDLTSADEVFFKIANLKPDSIIHTAAITQVDVCEQDHETCWLHNVKATEYLLSTARVLNAYFQYISTDFVFDGNEGPYSEESTPNPVNYYGSSKLAAEQLVLESGLRASIVRTVLVYGYGRGLSRDNIVLWVKKKLESNQAIRVVNDQWRTPTLVEDLAAGCRLILEKGATGMYHISGKDFLTPYDLAIKVAEIFNLDKRLISPTNATEFTEIGRRPLRTGFDISKAIRELGYKPRSLEEGLKLLKSQIENQGENITPMENS